MAKNVTSDDPSGELSVRLAEGFDKIVNAAFRNGNISVDVVATGCAILLSTYSLHLPLHDRAAILSETVEAIIASYREHPDEDLVLQH
jgi:hypothetical protein